MFDWLVEIFHQAPYPTVAVVFLVCGLGFPFPEELVLIAAGYVCFKDMAHLAPMILTCIAAILAGDLIPFGLGRIFGTRLLRLRPMRILVNKRRLSTFDRWFRRRGDLVIFLARFLTGVRIVAYFTAGTMRMSVARFIALDLLGIVLVVPILVGVGYSSGSFIDQAIEKVQKVERGLLWGVGIAAVVIGIWYWLRRRRRQASAEPSETFVGPTVRPAPEESAGEAPPGVEPSAERGVERGVEPGAANTPDSDDTSSDPR